MGFFEGKFSDGDIVKTEIGFQIDLWVFSPSEGVVLFVHIDFTSAAQNQIIFLGS